MPENETPLNSETVTPQSSDTVTKEVPSMSKTPDVSTTSKADISTSVNTEDNSNETITRLNGRIDELERRLGEREKSTAPEKIETKEPDTAPKSTHPWFRNPFVSG